MQHKTEKLAQLEEAGRLFDSVWARVMSRTPETATALTEAPPAVPLLLDAVEDKADDFPTRQHLPFLGEDTLAFSDLLLLLLAREYKSLHLYRQLAQRIGGIPAHSFSQMASDANRAVKRLSAAYFLLSGIRPQQKAPQKTNLNSYLHQLRQCFMEEQQSFLYYLAGMAELADDWLYQLYASLAEEKLQHAQMLCRLVEESTLLSQ